MSGRVTGLVTALVWLLAAAACAAPAPMPARVASTLPPTPDVRAALPYAITLPPGFHIHYYAQTVPGARSLTLSPSGTVFVGTRDAGKVYALLDDNRDGIAEQVKTIAQGLDTPNGVAFHDGALYVAEVSRILRFDDIEARLDNPPAPVVVYDGYPADAWHGWKILRVGPDDHLYVPVGAPCNVCRPDDEIYGTITRLALDGSSRQIAARGVRNSVGLDWDPQTQELWFTDNGRDDLGDDLPPDELNHAPQPGLHFGFPYCHAGVFPDPEFGSLHACDEFTPPAMSLGPHVAALGMRFYTGDAFPAAYRNQIFIAEHGSWNRSVPIGYRISLVRLQDGQAASYEVFAEGWLQDSAVQGRPVDVLVLADGSLLVSDDLAGAVYRITYE